MRNLLSIEAYNVNELLYTLNENNSDEMEFNSVLIKFTEAVENDAEYADLNDIWDRIKNAKNVSASELKKFANAALKFIKNNPKKSAFTLGTIVGLVPFVGLVIDLILIAYALKIHDNNTGFISNKFYNSSLGKYYKKYKEREHNKITDIEYTEIKENLNEQYFDDFITDIELQNVLVDYINYLEYTSDQYNVKLAWYRLKNKKLRNKEDYVLLASNLRQYVISNVNSKEIIDFVNIPDNYIIVNTLLLTFIYKSYDIIKPKENVLVNEAILTLMSLGIPAIIGFGFGRYLKNYIENKKKEKYIINIMSDEPDEKKRGILAMQLKNQKTKTLKIKSDIINISRELKNKGKTLSDLPEAEQIKAKKEAEQIKLELEKLKSKIKQ